MYGLDGQQIHSGPTLALCGAYSPTSRMRAEKYLKAGYYDLVGTDTHSNRFLQFFAKAGVPNKLVNLLPEQPERL